jgi:hypothetical protein
MTTQRQTIFPNSRQDPALSLSTDEIMLEGMKVLFDDKVGLYPVTLVARGVGRTADAALKDRTRGREHVE